MTQRNALIPIAAVARAWAAMAREQSGPRLAPADARLKVWLDCDSQIEDAIRTAVDFVAYVDSQKDADLCIHAATADYGDDGGRYDVSFSGLGAFAGIEAAACVTLADQAATDRTAVERRPPSHEVAQG
jgi:hypothetical protein